MRGNALRVRAAVIEYRTPSEEDRPAIQRLALLAFPVPAHNIEERMRRLRLDRYVGAYESGRLVATAQVHPLRQWFGGRPVTCAGIGSVTSAPERRGGGVATGLMRHLLQAEREGGAAVSVLYPATVPVYRRLGYEYAGTFTEYRAKLRALPRADGGVVEAFEDDDVEPLRQCFRRFAAGQNGLVDCDEPDWWTSRVLRRVGPEVVAHAVVVPGSDGIDGYAAFTRESDPTAFGFRLECTHLVGTTRDALAGLLGYFRRFQGVGQELRWQGPPNEPVAFLLSEQSLEPTFTFRWMLRILDVVAALEGRGYQEVSGEATIAVGDDLFTENAGTFHISAVDGKVRVERTDAHERGGTPLPIGMLSSLYSGYVTASDLVRLGFVDAADPGLPVLTRLFAGPPPWMPDFF